VPPPAPTPAGDAVGPAVPEDRPLLPWGEPVHGPSEQPKFVSSRSVDYIPMSMNVPRSRKLRPGLSTLLVGLCVIAVGAASFLFVKLAMDAGKKHTPVVRAGSWQRFESETGRFRVKLPAQPVEQSPTATVAGYQVVVHQFMRGDGDRQFLVEYADLPQEVSVAAADTVFSGSVSGAAAAGEGTVKEQHRIRVGPYPGVEAVVSIPHGAIRMRGVLTGIRYYALIEAGPQDDPGGFKQLTDSFKILGS
jgi:hypothetical protein